MRIHGDGAVALHRVRGVHYHVRQMNALLLKEGLVGEELRSGFVNAHEYVSEGLGSAFRLRGHLENFADGSSRHADPFGCCRTGDGRAGRGGID